MSEEVMLSEVMYNWLNVMDFVDMKSDFIAVLKLRKHNVYYVFFKRNGYTMDTNYKCFRNYPHRGYQAICDGSEPYHGTKALGMIGDLDSHLDLIRFYPTNYTLSDEDRPLFSKQLTLGEIKEVADAFLW